MSLIPLIASCVVAHNLRVSDTSKSGGGRGPFRRFGINFAACELDSLGIGGAGSSVDILLRRAIERFLASDGTGEDSDGVYGRISFFCFDFGRISSKSTGTPSDTRKSRRIRERTQFGGCKGGGAISCCQSESERFVKKVEFVFDSGGSGSRGCEVVAGNNVAMCGAVISRIDSRLPRDEKSSTGCSYS